MNKPGDDPNSIESVDRAFGILDIIAKSDGLTLTEIANELSIPKSSLHRHLSTLTQLGAVTKEDGEYHLGLHFLYYGIIARKRHDPRSVIRDGVRYLAEQTDERAQYMVWEHNAVIYIYRELGSHGVQTDTMTGKWMPPHATSGGKAILAHLPSTITESYFSSRTFKSYTDHTITDADTLREELDRIRDLGYSINDEEYIEGLRAVSVPVKINEDELIGAISVSGPSHRFREDRLHDELPNLLLGVANEIELKYTYQQSGV